MRELKFKAWDRATKRMYPEPFYLFGETTCFDLLRSWVMEEPMGKPSLLRMNDIEIMQFIGIKDKNGKEIYEGDILKMRDEDGDVEMLGKVWFYDCYYPGFDIYIPSKRMKTGFESYSDEFNAFTIDGLTYEVIGNIYENRNLLLTYD